MVEQSTISHSFERFLAMAKPEDHSAMGEGREPCG